MPQGDVTYDLHRKAVKLRNELFAQQAELENSLMATAFGRILDEARGIIISKLIEAIETTKEYNISSLKVPLIGLFNDPNLLGVDAYGNVYHRADEIVGNYDDFFDGVNYARSVLGLDESKSSGQKRAQYWRERIYAPYRLSTDIGGNEEEESGQMDSKAFAKLAYERTIEARIQGWAGKAPYWKFIEEGNDFSSFAFPRFPGTYFLTESMIVIQALFQNSLNNLEQEANDIINKEILDFVENPELYEPGTIFDEIIVEGKKYYIYVTPTKQLGTAQRPRY